MYWKLLNKTAAVLLLNVATGVAFAQFAWIDAKGVRQYSDQPPPSTVPKSQILKQPAAQQHDARASGRADAGTGDAEGPVAPVTAPKAPSTLADRNTDFNKRRAEQAEKDKKTAEESRDNAAKAKNCDRAQAYARTLDSGERVTSTDSKGERIFLSDEKRVQETSDTKRVLASCK